ncbi:hypothetical protein F5X98DRAFT_334493 [Xylaria grammica]|nr:hypothetical protein F5X98DRAFT_334493 [Xylaria grammica]
MDQRTYESPMEWEYQDTGPMDHTSPFVTQSSKTTQRQGTFGNASGSSIFNQNGFGRTPMTPSKPLPPTPMPMLPPSSSIFTSSHAKTTPAAPSFRNPAFTTPRKPFDVDAMSEISPPESSPAATDGSDFPETPDHDQSLVVSDITATPASISAYKSPFAKKASGKGEISKALFPPRDRIRKRKWHATDKDLGRYRLPYIQPGEGDGSDYDSDESTTQLNRSQSRHKRRKEDGWFGSFLAAIQRHPYAPSILGYWLNFSFSLICVTGTVWIVWSVIAGLHADFAVARSLVRDGILDEMSKCRSDYIDNKCSPIEQRLPAMHQLCEQWYACMNKNPDNLKKIQLGAKSIVEIINEIVDTMSYKTIGLLIILFAVFLFSGRSLYKTAHDYPDFTRPAPAYNQPHHGEHTAPQHVYWEALQPRTPRHALRHFPANDETPESDVSPPKFKALPAPETPSIRRSPSKTERGRSPMKSRSPTKRY